MPAKLLSPEQNVDALLSGHSEMPRDLLELVLPGGNSRADSALAALFWAKWQRQSGLDNAYLAALEPLQRALELLPAAEWIRSEQHPFWQLLGVLHASGMGYLPTLGRAAEKMIADLAPLWLLLRAGDWAGAANKAVADWQSEQNRQQRLEQRLVDSELGALINRRAQQEAARVLNRVLGGKHLSEALQTYFHEVWYRDLQWCFLQFGATSKEWQRQVDFTAHLIDSLQDPGVDLERMQTLYAQIEQVNSELRAVLSVRAPDPQTLEQQLALIEQHHVALMKGRPLSASPCRLISNEFDALDETTRLSKDLLQQVEALTVGSWFLLQKDDEELRVKLVLKIDDTSQLLFVNRLSVKALQKSFEEFAYLLAIDLAAPLPPFDHAREALRQLLVQLLQRGMQRQRQREEEAERDREQQRLAEEAEAQRRAAHEKAIAEATALAEAQAKAVAEQQATLANQAREQEQLRRSNRLQAQSDDIEVRTRIARQTATLIAVGSWVDFHDEMGGVQRLKLAVKLPSTGKMIFVDHDGMRQAEYERDAFIAKFMEGSIDVLDRTGQFDDALARVVGSLRRDRSKE